jgi:hypothetical protein
MTRFKTFTAFGLLVLWLGVANAQVAPNAPPPIRPTVDANGVNLGAGTWSYSSTDLTIGPVGAGGMVFSRSYYRAGWRHNYIGSISKAGNILTVSLGIAAKPSCRAAAPIPRSRARARRWSTRPRRSSTRTGCGTGRQRSSCAG